MNEEKYITQEGVCCYGLKFFKKKKNRSNRVLIWFAATGIWWQKNIGSFVMYALGSGLVIIVREYTWGIGKFCGSFKSIVSTCMSQKYL